MLGWIKSHRGVAVAAAFVIVALAVFVLVWFQPQKLFIDERVDEAEPTVPTPLTTVVPATTTLPATTTTEGTEVTTTTGGAATTTTTEAAAATAAPGPATLAVGEFVDVAHQGSGTALVLLLEDGSRVLRLEDLDVLNGPDLRVILSDRLVSGGDDYADGVFIDLGPLKGNLGNQNYEIPPEADLSGVQSVAIWCRRFNTTFNAATLTP